MVSLRYYRQFKEDGFFKDELQYLDHDGWWKPVPIVESPRLQKEEA